MTHFNLVFQENYNYAASDASKGITPHSLFIIIFYVTSSLFACHCNDP